VWNILECGGRPSGVLAAAEEEVVVALAAAGVVEPAAPPYPEELVAEQAERPAEEWYPGRSLAMTAGRRPRTQGERQRGKCMPRKRIESDESTSYGIDDFYTDGVTKAPP
jgi:hypothetical protein